MARKFLSIILLWFCVTIYESCCERASYFLYKDIEVEVLDQSIAADDSLALQIFPIITRYVAQERRTAQSAFAWQCEQGESGPKIPILEIKVITLEDFDPDHAKGESINDLLMIEYYPYLSYDKKVSQLNMLEEKKNIFRGTVWTHSRPTLSTSINFRVEIKNANGEVSSITTPIITWN